MRIFARCFRKELGEPLAPSPEDARAFCSLIKPDRVMPALVLYGSSVAALSHKKVSTWRLNANGAKAVSAIALSHITAACNFTMEVACSDKPDKPFMQINGGDASALTYRFVLRGANHEEAHHWEAVRLMPDRTCLNVCRAVAGVAKPRTATTAASHWRRRMRRKVVRLEKHVEELKDQVVTLTLTVDVALATNVPQPSHAPKPSHKLKGKPIGKGFNEFIAFFKQAHPGSVYGKAASQVSKLVGEAWQAMNEVQKQPYREQFEQELQSWATGQASNSSNCN